MEPAIPSSMTVKTFDDILEQALRLEVEIRPTYVIENMIKYVEEVTRGQRNNVKWSTYRKGRLAASNFGRTIIQLKRNSFPPSFYKQLLGEYHLEGAKSVMYGVVHDGDAVAMFEKFTGLKTDPCGLFLHKSGTIGATRTDWLVRPAYWKSSVYTRYQHRSRPHESRMP